MRRNVRSTSESKFIHFFTDHIFIILDVAGFGLSASVFTGKQSNFSVLEPVEEDYQEIMALLEPGTKTDDDLLKEEDENINK